MPGPERLREFAAAKINLFLHAGEKRADGYHDLESLVVFANVGDELSFAPSTDLRLSLDGPFAAGLTAEPDNLVLRAARALGVTADIVLTKNLPVASGIGGGSADAAAALRGLARLHPELGADETKLLALAETLGSDVPACLLSKPLTMRGRGERLEPLPHFPALHAVLANPGVAVPTGKVFAALETRTGSGHASQAFDLSGTEPLLRYLATTKNDLEAPALCMAPAIGDVLGELRRMPGIRLARMSGSGATCFGLFDTAGAAAMVAIALERSHQDWWVEAVRLG